MGLHTLLASPSSAQNVADQLTVVIITINVAYLYEVHQGPRDLVRWLDNLFPLWSGTYGGCGENDDPLKDITDPPRQRLPSHHPIWSSLPGERPAAEQWRTQRDQMEVPNQQLISDPAAMQLGVELPRGLFTVLNRSCSSAGPCCSSLNKWGSAALLFVTVAKRTMDHIVNQCDQTALEGGQTALSNCIDEAIDLFKDLCDSIR